MVLLAHGRFRLTVSGHPQKAAAILTPFCPGLAGTGWDTVLRRPQKRCLAGNSVVLSVRKMPLGHSCAESQNGFAINLVAVPRCCYTTLAEALVRRALTSLAISTGISIDMPASMIIPQSGRLIG